MDFWFFMLAMALLIPVTMLVFGWLFVKSAPKQINAVFGYRTVRSMKNRDTWDFAHHYCGRVWLCCGFLLLPASLLVMLLVLGKTKDTIGAAGALLVLAQLIPLAGSIVPTERALKKNFDENGRRRRTP